MNGGEGGSDRTGLPPVGELRRLLDLVLDATVRRITGDPAASAREGQRQLSHELLGSMLTGGTTAAEAPTGSGKSLAALAPAMLLAALGGHRSMVSTETISLQSQYSGKDAPMVAGTVAEVTGRPAPTVAVLKGWSNYACSAAVAGLVSEMTGREIEDMDALAGAVAEGLPADADHPGLTELLGWAVSQAVSDGRADRGDYRGQLDDDSWGRVSVSPAECPGVGHCRFGDSCRPAAAREQVAAADVIVANHSLIATQAALAIPVAVGSDKIGRIDHLVIDEAHGLPGKVRDQGSVTVGSWRVNEVARAVDKAMDGGKRVADLVGEAATLARELDRHLASKLPAANRKANRGGPVSVAKVEPGDDPLDPVGAMIEQWSARAKRIVPKPASARTQGGMVQLWRVHAKIAALAADVKAGSEHTAGVARWIEAGTPKPGSPWSGASLKLAQISVSGALRANLYLAQTQDGDDDEGYDGEVGTPMSVAAMSATLPVSSVRDLGLGQQRTVYPSPFAAAYDRSLLYAPKPDAGLLGKMGLARPDGKGVDTAKHPDWAAPIIETLVSANGGAALVLAATVAAGKLYAERLRRNAGPWKVHSQWDGPAVQRLVAQWRDDHDSVLVGTRSLMTGVDAPGLTCSLVIVDRVPRAASNPVDDARVEDLVERAQIDRWHAERLVYVADAALLLEQAAGRLIRADTDGGVVAVLDPRLLKIGGLSYPHQTRQMLLGALERFEHKTADLKTVCDLLSGTRRAA